MPEWSCVHDDCKREKEIYNFCEYHFVNYFVKQKKYYGDKVRPSASYILEELRRRDPSLINSELFREELQLWRKKGVSIRRVNKLLKEYTTHSKILHPDSQYKETSCSVCLGMGLRNCICGNYGQTKIDYSE